MKRTGFIALSFRRWSRYSLSASFLSNCRSCLEEFLERYATGERNFERVDLSGADLSGVDFGERTLRRIDYNRRIFLSFSNLSNANLSGANLSCAVMDCVNLSGANLSSANLYCAQLDDAKLKGANLSFFKFCEKSGLSWSCVGGTIAWRCRQILPCSLASGVALLRECATLQRARYNMRDNHYLLSK